MALREINLVPAETLSRRYLLRHLSLWAAALVLCLLLIFGFHFYQTHVLLAKERILSGMKDVPSHLSLKIEEIRKIQEDLEKLRQQQGIIEAITRNQPYFTVLRRVARIMNESTWLSQLYLERIKEGEGIADLRLSGYTFSNETLGAFLNTLSNDTMFRSVVLKYANETEIRIPGQGEERPQKMIQFMVECSIVRL